MKADAIRECVAAAATTNTPPPKEVQAEALAEVLDIALGFFANVSRIADAIDKLTRWKVDGQ